MNDFFYYFKRQETLYKIFFSNPFPFGGKLINLMINFYHVQNLVSKENKMKRAEHGFNFADVQILMATSCYTDCTQLYVAQNTCASNQLRIHI